ncbi:hypothetical protein [Tolypothrix sp. VBCCA 56010]|uniref:hypothetical protein n=1 Tax=Tolypothrix sp. VBCCA 56010 TaxID=3137731 RepID=UPI003D7E06AB
MHLPKADEVFYGNDANDLPSAIALTQPIIKLGDRDQFVSSDLEYQTAFHYPRNGCFVVSKRKFVF